MLFFFRPRRARKEVNYSFDAYDAAIRAALRQGSSEPEGGRATGGSRFQDSGRVSVKNVDCRLHVMTAVKSAFADIPS